MQDRDSIFTGILLGSMVPVIGYIVIDQLFNVLVKFELMSYVSPDMLSERSRTILLLALCCNLIPFNFARKKRWDDTMRGIIFPTILYVGFWVYTFKDQLMIF